ncbi:YqhA family protein [Rhodospirillaceae bacterium SYSU D60014]|uniref:YqhA family protein n=1 Tax=Virgifigura deserti TaxID=2268457 RepID=UPI000E6606B1
MTERASPPARNTATRNEKETALDLRHIERRTIVGSRFLTVVAVFGSLAGSVLMFFLGIVNIYAAFLYGFQTSGQSERIFGSAAIISVIESLDRFLIAIVLLYFAYGVYTLFIHPEESEEALALPAWLRVRQIGQLKQVVAELIVVILFVLFLRQALQSFSGPDASLTWNEIATLAVLPVSTVLLALALKLVEFHPKSGRPLLRPDTSAKDEP